MHASKSLKYILHNPKSPLVVPGVFDCMSGLLAQRVGFKAIYVSGAALSVTQLGLPDIGHLSLSDVARVVNNIHCVTSIPIIVDADTGFGGVSQIERTVQVLELAGASAIQIEDQEFPKRCGHLKGKTLVSLGEMVRKIQAAVAARKSKNTLIIARTDARGVYGFKEAYRRAKVYKLAGADVIFPEALKSTHEFAQFGRKKELGTLMANMTEFGLSPALSATELVQLGFQIVLFPMTVCRVAAFAMEGALQSLKAKGTSRQFISTMQTRSDLYKLIGYHPQ